MRHGSLKIMTAPLQLGCQRLLGLFAPCMTGALFGINRAAASKT